MDLNEAREMAESLMREHLAKPGWSFEWDRSVNRFGQCIHVSRKITLSRKLSESNDIDLVRDTILHEIAHANLGTGFGHGPEWRREARRLGAQPTASQTDPSNLQAQAPWVGRCAKGHVSPHRFWRKPKRQRSCPVCYPLRFNADHLLTYTKEEN